MESTDEVIDPSALPLVPPEPLAPIESRFLFVDVAAQRAKQLRRGALLRVERHPAGPHKLERLAMEEVRQQLVQYTVPPGYLGKGEGR
jgi:DNA-directed RNA polymerase subunit K/omega